MFMGSSSTEIIFHISATAWDLWGSKSAFLLPVPMGNIMGKKTDWIVGRDVLTQLWASLFMFGCVCSAYSIARGEGG